MRQIEVISHSQKAGQETFGKGLAAAAGQQKPSAGQRQVLPYLAAFLLPFGICAVICIANGVYPFGTNCILHVDMYHQYCPFFTEFWDKLHSGRSLMYSWRLGLGSDFVSLYAYYLASPLNWLILLCPRDFVIEFMTLLILVKIGACSAAFFYYLKEHYQLCGKDGRFHRRTMLPALVFSSAYALSGFVAAYSWDIMWLDCVALLPVILVGLEKLVYEGRAALYYVSLAVCIFANYYISIMICIFAVFCFALLFFSPKENLRYRGREELGSSPVRWRAAAAGRFALYSLLAGGTSAVLLLPEIAVLGASGSAGDGFPETAEWYFSVIAELGRGAAAASVYTGDDHWPNLYAGAFCLVLVWMYLLNRRISWKEKLPRFAMLGFFLVSFAHNRLDYIWHGMHFPQSLPGRQSFLYIFLLLSMCFAQVRKWNGTRRWHIVAASVLALLALLAASVAGDSDVTEPYALVLTALFVMLYGILLLILKLTGSGKGPYCGRRSAGKRNVRLLLPEAILGFAVLELAVNMAVTGFQVTSRTAYVEKQRDYRELLALAEQDSGGSGFYRVEDTGRKTKNDDALYGYASATIFSSLMNLDVSHLFQGVYMEGGKNFYSYNGSTPLTSAMLSVKYILSDSPLEENALHRLAGRSGNSYLYENTYCLPFGYLVGAEVFSGWEPNLRDRRGSLNRLAFALGAGEELLARADCRVTVEAGETTVEIPEDGYYYAAYDSCDQDTLTVSRTDGWRQKYSKTTHRYLINLGDCEAGEEVMISNSGEEYIGFTVYRLSFRALEQAYRTLARDTMVLTEMTDRLVRGQIAVEEAGWLLLSIPADEGWSLYVDGHREEITPWQDALVAVELDPGEHRICLRYTTPGFLAGLTVSAGCAGLFLALCGVRLLRGKRRRQL